MNLNTTKKKVTLLLRCQNSKRPWGNVPQTSTRPLKTKIEVIKQNSIKISNLKSCILIEIAQTY